MKKLLTAVLCVSLAAVFGYAGYVGYAGKKAAGGGAQMDAGTGVTRSGGSGKAAANKSTPAAATNVQAQSQAPATDSKGGDKKNVNMCVGEGNYRNYDCIIKDYKSMVDKLGYPWNLPDADWAAKCTAHATESYVCSVDPKSSVQPKCPGYNVNNITTKQWRYIDLFRVFLKYTVTSVGQTCSDSVSENNGVRYILFFSGDLSITRCCPNAK